MIWMMIFQSTDLDLEDVFFIVFFVEFVNSEGDVSKRKGRYENTASRVFGYGALMDTYALPSGYVADLGHLFFEAWRPRHLKRVDAGGDEEISVFKGRDTKRIFVKWQVEDAGNGVAVRCLTD